MVKFWFNEDKLVVDGDGKLIDCEDCPCDEPSPCENCGTTPAVMVLRISGVTGNTAFNGDWELTQGSIPPPFPSAPNNFCRWLRHIDAEVGCDAVLAVDASQDVVDPDGERDFVVLIGDPDSSTPTRFDCEDTLADCNEPVIGFAFASGVTFCSGNFSAATVSLNPSA
jgi:hypothetical protein